MIETYGDDARALDLMALGRLVPDLPRHLWTVLRATQDWLGAQELDLGGLRAVYATAEQARKGLRARLPDNVAGRQRRAEWDPQLQPLAVPLHYRWSNVRRLMNDLHPS